MSRTLIRGGWVLTLGAKTPNHAKADVLIEGDRIAEIGPGLRARDADVVDAADAIVLPGFVDAHRHAWKTLLRNAGSAPASALAAGRHHEPEDVYAATLLGLVGAAETGITTVADWADVCVSDDHVQAALQAHADAGLRTVFVAAAPAWSGSELQPWLRLAQGAAAARGPLTTIAAGLAEPHRGQVEDFVAARTQARELGLRVHSHAGGRAEDAGVAAELAAAGALDANVTVVHGSHLDDGDLDAISAQRSGFVTTPANEMATGRGAPPLQRLIDRGIRPGLGVDDELLAPGDVFTQMRATQSLQHATLFDLKLAGKGGVPNLLSTRDVIRYATLDGARAIGLAEAAGSLEVGKQADVLVLRADRPNISPVNDPIGAVVWGMDASNVDWVFVAGRAIVTHGTPTTDVAHVRRLALAAHERITAAAGGEVFETSVGGAR